MSYLEVVNLDYGLFDAETLKSKGGELSDAYANADPFPHIVIDDFVTPAMLDVCLRQFPAAPDPDSASFDRAQERYKTSFNPDYLAPPVRSFFYSLNSRPFCQFLENLTGIKGLIPDPLFLGGGFHQTTNGGHLSVHADFNLHGPLNLQRRINVLIYLNRDWPVEYGGALELWDQQMKACVRKVAPEFGRCVVFSTNATSFHGHPDPINHPKSTPRRSIALYYYTATWDGRERQFTTQFKRRPRSGDALDWRVKTDELIDDWTPPVLARTIKRVAGKLIPRR
ncbi:MAG: 2OG-Fe(II) oxygenase [Parvularculaceae bacterium]|nr:2OG-Fe(II) oxygenase [Parvularculaceae bacterium]